MNHEHTTAPPPRGGGAPVHVRDRESNPGRPRRVATGLLFVLAVAFSGFACSGTTHAAEWGTLKGRFVYGGDAPEQPKLDLNKDVEFCGKHDPREESLVVDPKTKGIANVVIWLDERKSDRELEIHDSYAKSFEEPVVIANAKCRFEPHVQVMRAGQTLKTTNEDAIAHATAIFFLKNTPSSTTIPVNGQLEREVEKSEPVPCQVTCPIHAWMKGFLVVKDHPYVAVTKSDGSFEIANLPAGEWTFRVWHETPGYVDEVTIAGDETKWRSGRFTVTIPKEKVEDVGTVTIAAEAFE